MSLVRPMHISLPLYTDRYTHTHINVLSIIRRKTVIGPLSVYTQCGSFEPPMFNAESELCVTARVTESSVRRRIVNK